MVIIFFRMTARPEKLKELSQSLQSIIEKVRKESGCLYLGFYQSYEDKNKYLLIEEWASQKDSNTHLQSDYFKILQGAGILMQHPPEITIHTVDSLMDSEP
jgi:quinol monooxygenase YgiN